MDYITLVGAEDVANAARTMARAADVMQNAANSMESSRDSLQRFLENWLDELNAVLQDGKE